MFSEWLPSRYHRQPQRCYTGLFKASFFVRKYTMKWSTSVAIGYVLSLVSSIAGADTLGEIYELALENDAQLRGQEATYRANLESENLGRSALLPQINANYDYTNTDTDTESEGIDLVDGVLGPVDSFTNTDIDRDGYQVWKSVV